MSDIKNVKALRKKMNLSQSEFSRYFGIPVATLQRWEHGQSQPKDYMFRMMVRLYELDPHGSESFSVHGCYDTNC